MNAVLKEDRTKGACEAGEAGRLMRLDIEEKHLKEVKQLFLRIIILVSP